MKENTTTHLVGKHAEDGDVWVEVDVTDGRLSIVGVVGPRRNGNAKGGCGQCQDVLLEPMTLYTGWTPGMVNKLYQVWKRWHLNDMRAGTPAQEEFLRTTEQKFPGYPASHYDWAKGVLAAAGLQPDDGYSYGSAWLPEELPADVIEFVTTLPAAPKAYPWAPDQLTHR